MRFGREGEGGREGAREGGREGGREDVDFAAKGREGGREGRKEGGKKQCGIVSAVYRERASKEHGWRERERDGEMEKTRRRESPSSPAGRACRTYSWCLCALALSSS